MLQELLEEWVRGGVPELSKRNKGGKKCPLDPHLA
jgi:hypothetical protein